MPDSCIYSKHGEYSVILLENGWVKRTIRYADAKELKDSIPSKYYCIEKINNDIKNFGISRIKIWKGFFKTIEFHITGIWNY